MRGVALADSRGLCLVSQGECSSKLAGKAAVLTSLASQIEPEEDDPVILIESRVRKYLVKKEDNITVLISKQQQ